MYANQEGAGHQTNLWHGDVLCKKLCQLHSWLCRCILHFVRCPHQTTPVQQLTLPKTHCTCPLALVHCCPWTSWHWKAAFPLWCLWKLHWLQSKHPWHQVSEQKMVVLNKKSTQQKNLIFLTCDDQRLINYETKFYFYCSLNRPLTVKGALHSSEPATFVATQV